MTARPDGNSHGVALSPALLRRRSTLSATPGVEVELPVAALRLWGGADAQESLPTQPDGDPPLLDLGDGQIALLPGPGRPDVFDRAFLLARRWLEEGAAAGGGGERRVLVAAARVRIGAEVEWIDDEVVGLLRGPSAGLAAGRVHATSHALHGAEGRYRARAIEPLALPSGHRLPILVIEGRAERIEPWRNREALGVKLRWLPRPELEQRLGEAMATHEVVRVSGPPGVGKSRLVATVLEGLGAAAAWIDLSLDRRRVADFVARLPRVERGPSWLVVDSLEAADATAWRELDELVRWNDSTAFRWLLIGRAPLGWSPGLQGASLVQLPAFDHELAAAAAKPLFEHLAVPGDVAAELLAVSAGNPFAVEELLIQLARDRQIRQVFGNFFYQGGGRERMRPTPRLTLHLEAELRRLGSAAIVRMSSSVEPPVPTRDLREAASSCGFTEAAAGWEGPYLAADLLELAPGPWGEGVVWRVPAFQRAVAATLAAETRATLAGALGERLVNQAEQVEQIWRAYPLLAGSLAGARALLAVSSGGENRGPSREELLNALLVELEAARGARPRHPALELELLWTLMPLARRLGRLHELHDIIERAMLLAEDEDRPDRLMAFAAVQAEVARKVGRLDEAEEVLKRALRAARGSDERRQGPLLLELARIVAQRGRPEEARDLLEKTLVAAESRGRSSLAASCRFLLGDLALSAYRLDEARELHETVLKSRREVGMPGAIAQSLTALGSVALQQGNAPDALDHYREAVEIGVANGLEGEEALAQLGVGRALTRLGDFVAASQALRRGLALRQGRDDALGEGVARLEVAENYLHLDQVELALREARRAHFDVGLLGDESVLADAEQLLGRISLRQQHVAAAAVHFAEAERLHRATGRDQAVLSDLSLSLRAALAGGEIGAVGRAFDALASERRRWPQVPASEPFELDLYRGARWLNDCYAREIDALPYLRRAYSELMRRTAFLEPSLRQRFLFQVPEHQAIVDAAGAEGIEIPSA